MEQLTLPIPVDPGTCPYKEDMPSIGRVLCHKDGRNTFTNCTESVCGEPPMCAWEEPDNSKEAKSRRLEWMRTHKEDE